MLGRKIKAVALISGGLDSLLATRLILDQGIHVEGINFYTGFCVEGHTHAIRKQFQDKPKRNNALWAAEKLGIELHFLDVVEEYKSVLLNPKYGYGANLNPCLDCKIFMVQKAKIWMEENNFDFVITGEVMGQRPMSQKRKKMAVVSEESEIFDLLVRPLSAKHLPETKPEREGWIDREKLLNFHGRNRKPQIELAKKYGFVDYAQPAGGCCFLTNEHYSKKLADLWGHRGEKNYELDDILLLKIGRHLRPKPEFKLIIGREEGENNFLSGYKKRSSYFEILSHEGPLVLVDGKIAKEDRVLAARIVARYSQGREAPKVDLIYKDNHGISYSLSVPPFKPEEIQESWYV